MANPIHQFEIQPIIPFEIGNIDLSFTNSALWMLIGAVLSISFLMIASGKKAMVPGRLQMFSEILYEFIAKMVRDNIGSKGRKYFPFIFTLFIFVLMGNLLGLLPYSFTYTSHLAVTGILALIVFFMIIIFGILHNGLKFFTIFIPPGAPLWLIPFLLPIEIISFFIRPITLSVRLFSNIMAGHIVLKVIAGFAAAAVSVKLSGIVIGIFPAMINVVMMMFELLVALIQAYVFAILSCVYLKDSVDLHH
ncbi:MAG: F0F1 ATP synthase subunit A [Alphaproteobacteria bacterium]|nr:F0F1 ATP synthase subunit A [Alphaproteobacteria bacterium]